MDKLNQAGPARERVQANYLNVLERIQAAATRSARESKEIRLIAVTKSVDSTIARWLVEFGCCDLAESRPQVLWEKAASLTDLPVRWHMIGHMQRNKVKRTMPLVSVMHSLDSSRILEQIQQDLAPRPVPLELLLELNISGEPDKTGMLISSAEELLTEWQTQNGQFPGLAIEGLMGMGSLNGGLEQARRPAGRDENPGRHAARHLPLQHPGARNHRYHPGPLPGEARRPAELGKLPSRSELQRTGKFTL